MLDSLPTRLPASTTAPATGSAQPAASPAPPAAGSGGTAGAAPAASGGFARLLNAASAQPARPAAAAAAAPQREGHRSEDAQNESIRPAGAAGRPAARGTPSADAEARSEDRRTEDPDASAGDPAATATDRNGRAANDGAPGLAWGPAAVWLAAHVAHTAHDAAAGGGRSAAAAGSRAAALADGTDTEPGLAATDAGAARSRRSAAGGDGLWPGAAHPARGSAGGRSTTPGDSTAQPAVGTTGAGGETAGTAAQAVQAGAGGFAALAEAASGAGMGGHKAGFTDPAPASSGTPALALGALPSDAAPAGSPAGGASAAPASAPLGTGPGAPGFAPALGAQISTFIRQGVAQAELQLHPADMGPVAVQITLQGTAAQVHLWAEQAGTRQALEQAMPTLAGSLREAGLTLAGGGVFDQAQQARDEARQQPPRQGSAAGGRDTDDAPNRAGTDATGSTWSGGSRRARGVVDLVA